MKSKHALSFLFSILTTTVCMLMMPTTFAFAAPPVDLSGMPDNAVNAYNLGSTESGIEDIQPTPSNSSGYAEKWDFILESDKFNLRVKFEISNFAFSKNEGKIRGYLATNENGTEQRYELSQTFKKSEWTSETKGLNLTFGEYKVSYDGTSFHLDGVYEKGNFHFDIPANLWKPGTGNVYFGNSEENIFRYNLLTYHKTAKGYYTENGQKHEVSPRAYGNHYVTTVAVYDMYDEFADFRRNEEDIVVEFRYYVPSAKYPSEPFGFMFVAYRGVPVFSSTKLERTPQETWLDEDNYNYEIDARQRLTATDTEGNKAIMEMLTAVPTPSDPYADLPAFQRNIASRFAKPIEYSIKIDWELWLTVEGMKAKIPATGTYSLTRMR